MLDQIKAIVSPIMADHAAKAIGEASVHCDDALNKALPAILSAMVATTKVPSGLASLFKVVNDPVNDGALLTRLQPLYQGTMTSAPIYGLGAQLQQTIFGTKLPLVTQSIAALSGTKTAVVAQLVNKLSTHVLAHVGDRLRQSGTVSPAGLARLLQSEEKSFMAGLSPAIGAVLGLTPNTASLPTAAATAAALAATPAAVLAATQAAATPVAPSTKPATAPEKPDTPPASAATTVKATPAPAAPAPTARTVTAPPSGGARGVAQSASTATPRSGGFQPWTIFPIGLLVGGGLAGLAGMFGPAGLPSERTPAADRPMAAAPAIPTPAPKAVEAPKPTPPPKVVDVPKPVPTPPTPKAVEAPKPAPVAPAPKAVEAPPAPKPVPAPAAVADIARPLGAPGVTSFYGQSLTPAEKPAVMNPDYTPVAAAVAVAAAVVAAPAAPAKPAAPGVTTFFGSSPTPAEKPAIANLDYKPAAPAVVAVAPTPPAPPRALGAPGVTSFFGASPTLAEKPAVMNPDYKPGAKAVAAAPTAPAAPLTPSFKICQDNINAAVKTGGIRFNSAKSSLTDASIVTLTQISAAITACPGTKLSIEGHTDDTGDDTMNQKLSEDRASTVVAYLVGQGIDAKRLTSAGFGETRPVASNNSAANKARNRRIDFVVSER